MNSTFDPLVGQVLDGRYEIVAKIARGGMATVYRARDLRLSRQVAIKVMRSDLGEDDEFAAKFDREARAAAVLSHPNVVSIFDQGTSDGKPYIVMEFIDGETLRKVISREAPMSPERALDVFEQVAAALAAAHEAGVVHRDIKPENVLIAERGQIKVADFGLARQVGSPQMTATGVLVGTASYLPPELVTHSRPDGRSDVYSAGVVLFELLTGKKPHTGENNYQIAYRHVNVDIEKPSERLAEIGHAADWPIPDYIDTLVLAATARDPRARIVDGRELLTAVRRAKLELARGGGRDNPALAAALLPDSPPEEDTQPVRPRTGDRPRPASGPTPDTVIVSQEQWRAAVPSATPIPAPEAVPVSPRSPSSDQPRSQRTPVFPQLHVSQDPVHRRRRGAILLALVILVTAGLGVGSWWWTAGRYTTVPPLAAMNEVKAQEAAAANAIKLVLSEAYSETVPQGQVISTDPGPGDRVLRNSQVEVVMSRGPERYPMPRVIGLMQEAAEKAIVDGRMVVGKVTQAWSETKPIGEVLKASEKEDTPLKKGTAVDLTVSKGPKPIRFPDLVDAPAADATKQLEELGFEVKSTEEHSSSVEKGRVIRQDPKTGEGKKGDIVNIVVSLGPEMIKIPTVRLKPSDEAVKLLEDAGFKVEIERNSDFPIPLDLASGTNPAEGKEAPKGSTVILYVT
ncbi:MAG: Stk1 family PASTA domain-containing Ser/Thr kinase [Tessaracoccus sp.]|uniref:Stk1 family PASTA domain-containing Ser/Thr kinase n=1 Tax=Tessaracoccus sp. TaxID=1971211 RepID=UPI001EC98229|nr:Stk1 family PASTA domain-containing Ser/Thr kinase [Tessaracoccus sp.]MBK7821591.1 Stk1 family PASTA domain-containing Ser/Thr kinase [Tessaracoccus sp.]